MQDIYARSGAEKDFTEAQLTEYMCEFLVDQATIENYSYAGYKHSSRGIRVDAWYFNEETEILNLLVTDFRYSNSPETLSATEINRDFKRLEKFFIESLKLNFLSGLEESSSGYELAREIYENNKSNIISRIQFILLTNAQLSKRISTLNKSEINGIPCEYDIWDITRMFQIESSGKAREDVVVDFLEFLPNGIPCLPAFTGSDNYPSYLLVMPGLVVAELYNKYGERLLEQNVRTFLQFRGNVNKGIRNTIQNEPEMFFAYNNGLTATAENVQTDIDQRNIKSISNLQIVNGGQTTASIFTAMKKSKADLSNVFVQVKLTVIPPDKVEAVVPKISEFANTQNKVSAADFFSNHPFHLRMEEISRRIWAPSSQGKLTQTHWFYERARGQYVNAQANLTPAKKTEFLTQNPRAQMFTKTDLAKFEQSFNMLPHIVSLGAQKNFARFANDIGQKWDKNEQQFNELYFRNIVAKAILFRFLDKNILKQYWYGGYKANIVTYSIAKLTDLIAKTGKNLDLSQIWKDQKLSPPLESQLLEIAEVVNKHIQNTPENITNVTEWCKRESCWKKLQDLLFSLNAEVVNNLLGNDEVELMENDAKKTQKIDNGIVCQKYVVEKGSDYWKDVAKFGLNGGFLNEKEMNILEVACSIPNKLPSEKQSEIVVKIEEKLKVEGLFL